jgi:hypothetical protein
MVVHVINVKRVGIGKAEDHPPVRANRYRLKTLELALERMHPKAGQIHIGCARGRVEPGENIAQLNGVLGNHAARVVVRMKSLQSSVANRSDHHAP